MSELAGVSAAEAVSVKQSEGNTVIENSYLRVDIAKTGALQSVYFKPLEREVTESTYVAFALVPFV